MKTTIGVLVAVAIGCIGSAAMARIRIEHRGGKRFDTLQWLNKGA